MLGTEDGIQPALQGSRSQGGYIDPLPAALWTTDYQGFRELAAHGDDHAVLLSGFQEIAGNAGCGHMVQVENTDNIADFDGDMAAQVKKHSGHLNA